MTRLFKTTPASVARRFTNLAVHRRLTHPCNEPDLKPLLARSYGHAQGTGVIGPGAQRLLRTMLVNALTPSTERCDVVVTRFYLERLLGAESARLSPRFAPTLGVTETFEDAIEHLERRPSYGTTNGRFNQRPVLWLATPGADADVVTQALENRSAIDLIALFNGPWPYGPTQFIDHDGPRRLPEHTMRLLTRDQAVAKLHCLSPSLRRAPSERMR
ncbi:hypothetical protein [Actinomadura fibrosa]|uniref:Uncharacterized protein n=1 Tax=Actinomadura fibrosa TaxID=111802 RepID=A0ABW2Y3M8_9ACTN|nr:hypothetical protein [Actinomadura fibrosa]